MRRRGMFLVFGLGLGILQGCVTPPEYPSDLNGMDRAYMKQQRISSMSTGNGAVPHRKDEATVSVAHRGKALWIGDGAVQSGSEQQNEPGTTLRFGSPQASHAVQTIK